MTVRLRILKSTLPRTKRYPVDIFLVTVGRFLKGIYSRTAPCDVILCVIPLKCASKNVKCTSSYWIGGMSGAQGNVHRGSGLGYSRVEERIMWCTTQVGTKGPNGALLCPMMSDAMLGYE